MTTEYQEKQKLAAKRLEIAAQLTSAVLADGRFALLERSPNSPSIARAQDHNRVYVVEGVLRIADELIKQSGWEP